MKDFSESLAAVVTFLSNVLFWSEAGYFDSGSELKPLLHTWSLAVEEQFYIVLPFLIWLGWKSGRLHRTWLLATVGIASFLFAEWQANNYTSAAFFLLFARFWELLVGSGAALILLNQSAIKARLGLGTESFVNEFSGFAGLAMILLAIVIFDESTVFPGLSAALPVLGTAMIILFASSHTIVGRLLSWRLLVSVGLISYSAYLWHQPLFAFARYRELGLWRDLLFSLLTMLSLALAWLSWRYVERPFRNKAHFNRRQIFTAGFIISVFFLVLGVIGHKNNGFIKYRGSEQVQLLLKSARRDPDAPNCTTGGRDYRKPADSCILGKGTGRIAVLGDSHASIIAYQTAKALEPFDTGLRQLSFSGCDPTRGRSSVETPCAQWTQEAFHFLQNRSEINTVIVVYRMNAHLFGSHHHIYPKQPNFVDAQRREDRWHAFLKTISDLQKSGKQVVVLLPIPEVRRRIADIIFMDPQPGAPIISVSRSWWEDRNRYVLQHLNDIPEGTLIIDPTDLYCDAQACWALKNGEALYFDHNHLSRAGMLPLARLIVDCMDEHGYLKASPRPITGGICKAR